MTTARERQTAYLASQFLRLYPHTSGVEVSYDDTEESILVTVHQPNSPSMHFSHQCGSDDDSYAFVGPTTHIIDIQPRIEGLMTNGRWMQARTMYEHLAAQGHMKCVSHLTDAHVYTEVNGVPISIMSRPWAIECARIRNRSFIQRVYAHCDCSRLIPFGKLGQHRKACKA